MHHSAAPARRPSARALLIGGFLLILAGLVVGNLLRSSAPITSANPNNPRAVALGQEVYLAHCASCHGANLEGAPNWQRPNPDGTMPAPPHDASGHTWHHNDESLFTTVKYGSAATAPPALSVAALASMTHSARSSRSDSASYSPRPRVVICGSL